MLAGCLVLAENRRKGSRRVGSTVLGERTGATTRVLRERLLAQQEAHANDMHDLLVAHECLPILEK